MTYEKNKPTSRGWRQFSITALLVVTTIFAILFAWWRDRTQLLRRLERETERALREREMATEQAAISRKMEELSRQRAELVQAALRAATSQTTSSQQGGGNG